MYCGQSVTLRLNLRPSRIFTASSGVCHLLALISLFVTAIPAPLKVGLGGLVLLSWVVVQCGHGGLCDRWFVQQLEWCENGQWKLYGRDGRGSTARLVDCYVNPHLLVLNFAVGTFRRRSVLIFADSADSDEVRSLRMQLLRAYRGR